MKPSKLGNFDSSTLGDRTLQLQKHKNRDLNLQSMLDMDVLMAPKSRNHIGYRWI